MIKLLFLLFCVCSCSICIQAQKNESSDLNSMVETERAFARMSEEKGTQPAFKAFIAEDGILFRPKAVKGKQWMIDHPAPVSEKRPVLSWGPSFAYMATAGDMGYTFGPWQFKSDIKDARAVAWGHFITIWKKQPDGTWKFAVDLGVSHSEPTSAESLLNLSKDKRASSTATAGKPDAEKSALLELEQRFSEASSNGGARKAFANHAAAEVYVFRENKLPFSGMAAAAEAIPPGTGLWTWQPEGWDVSRSGDLGYSYGTYLLKSIDSAAKPETGNYFRIWKKQNGKWKVVVDVANPVAEKTN